MNQEIWAKARTRIMDAATGQPVNDWSEWQHNLIFDSTMVSLANAQIAFAGMTENCKVGSSNAVNEIVGGTTTFTQSGTTLTASANFFTNSMIGGIFKYGAVSTSSGAEQYISGVTSPTSATVSGPGMTVASPTAAAVWLVTQTSLTSWLFTSATYVTSPGNCGTFLTNTTLTTLRTYQFPVQGTTYSVSEIGYSTNNHLDGTCNGRIVLVTPDTITSSQYYVVQIAATYTVAPNTPTAVTNVGTGIDTSGTVMMQSWNGSLVGTDGASANFFSKGGMIDANDGTIALYTVSQTLNTNVSQSEPSFNPGLIANNTQTGYSGGAMSISGSGFAVATATNTATFATSTAGQVILALVWGSSLPWMALNLNNSFTLPNGSFNATFTLQRIVGRILTN